MQTSVGFCKNDRNYVWFFVVFRIYDSAIIRNVTIRKWLRK